MAEDFALTSPETDRMGRFGMSCCPECFEHEWVREFILQESRRTGACEFCETEGVPLLEVSALTGPFLNLTSIYSPVSDDNTMTHVEYIDAGETLEFLVQDGWGVFIEPDLGETLQLNGLLRAFAADLERHLDRGDDTSIYLPCQNLTDAVRDAGFDGIRYPSAMKPGGSNLVLFDPEDVEYVDSKLVEVTTVEVEFRAPEGGA